jgi:sugar (pentulose or hexulose) kinase
LKAWDFVHCPPWTDHVFVGAGDGSSAILAVGSRASQDIVYPVSEVAGRYGGSVETETPNPKEAYAPFGRSAEARYHGQLDAAS